MRRPVLTCPDAPVRGGAEKQVKMAAYLAFMSQEPHSSEVEPTSKISRIIGQWSEVPQFESEEEEAAFWAQSRIEPRLMNTAILKADTRESTTVTLRFDPRMLARIKRLARSRYLNYQSMVKQWLSERLEKEI